MAVKVDARIKEEYDPTRYIANMKEKLSKAEKYLMKLVKYLKALGHYDRFVKEYGEVPVCVEDDDEEDEAYEEIMGALTKQDTFRTKRTPLAAGESEALSSLPANEILDDGMYESEGAANPNLPQEVREVQKAWNNELRAHQSQMEKEIEMLRLRHIQDLEEARVAGCDETTLKRLRKDHEEELGLVKEQFLLLKEELVKQKQKEEAQILLTSASHTRTEGEAASSKEKVLEEDDRRINEMVTHLKETCTDKDDVLIKLFDLICWREAQVSDYETNAVAIALAQAENMVSDKEQLWTDAKQENLTLTTEVRELQEQNRMLHSDKRSLANEVSRLSAELDGIRGISSTASRSPEAGHRVAPASAHPSPPHRAAVTTQPTRQQPTGVARPGPAVTREQYPAGSPAGYSAQPSYPSQAQAAASSAYPNQAGYASTASRTQFPPGSAPPTRYAGQQPPPSEQQRRGYSGYYNS
eukprot:NODE_410_length_1691_cov_264.929354_g325_i0.p1 GENE.NODE_410_length_1691_cov_264.929354_g325_i0~~NODE_410_length_1691_cov_264.929354_g325_i0.p1  ORF type:complete len:513 (+),score=147.15 NODE_410_length_1691_cov_264.929354_g325_i0:135-1541(+)